MTEPSGIRERDIVRFCDSSRGYEALVFGIRSTYAVTEIRGRVIYMRGVDSGVVTAAWDHDLEVDEFASAMNRAAHE